MIRTCNSLLNNLVISWYYFQICCGWTFSYTLRDGQERILPYLRSLVTTQLCWHFSCWCQGRWLRNGFAPEIFLPEHQCHYLGESPTSRVMASCWAAEVWRWITSHSTSHLPDEHLSGVSVSAQSHTTLSHLSRIIQVGCQDSPCGHLFYQITNAYSLPSPFHRKVDWTPNSALYKEKKHEKMYRIIKKMKEIRKNQLLYQAFLKMWETRKNLL